MRKGMIDVLEVRSDLCCPALSLLTRRLRWVHGAGAGAGTFTIDPAPGAGAGAEAFASADVFEAFRIRLRVPDLAGTWHATIGEVG